MRTTRKAKAPKEPDEFEQLRRQRRRATFEESAASTRLRPLPTKFATEVWPEMGARMARYQAAEDQRIADERAALPTKPFAEMDAFEVIHAMASYDEPADYPTELERRIQYFVELPGERLTRSAKAALMEVTNIKQRIARGEREPWMVDRIAKLVQHRSETVAIAAAGLMLQEAYPPEELRPTREPPKPKKNRPLPS